MTKKLTPLEALDELHCIAYGMKKYDSKTIKAEKIIETALYKATQKLIDEYGFAEFYVYCSKINRKHYHLIEVIDTDTGKTEYEIDYYIGGSEDYLDFCFDGKVAFKFRCYKVEEIYYGGRYNQFDPYTACYYTNRLIPIYLKHRSCLEYDELGKYLNGHEKLKGKKGVVGTAIHISDLEIFDKPKELSEFSIKVFPHRKSNLMTRYLTKAPQSFAYIEVGE